MCNDPLSILALRYAARDLSAVETAAFEVRLAADRAAQEALAEAVRLSAAALGRPAPVPMTGIRGLIADRLSPVGSAVAGLFRRRAYRGHPMAWAGLGATAAATAVTLGVWLGGPMPADRIEYAVACTPPPADRIPAVAAINPVEADESPVPTAKAPIPRPMTGEVGMTVVPPGDDKNPMTSAAGSVSSTGGGTAEATPPNNRAKTYIPETDPPGKNPDDTFFGPYEPSTGS